jgi:hypothetical protein
METSKGGPRCRKCWREITDYKRGQKLEHVKCSEPALRWCILCNNLEGTIDACPSSKGGGRCIYPAVV